MGARILVANSERSIRKSVFIKQAKNSSNSELEYGLPNQPLHKILVHTHVSVADDSASSPNVRELLNGRPRVSTLAHLLKHCCQARSLSDGKLVHSYIINNNFHGNTFLGNWLVKMYGDCGSLKEATWTFHNLANPNLYSWTILMSAYAKNGRWREVIACFDQMLRHGIQLNHVSFVCAIDACAAKAALEIGRRIHALILEIGYEGHVSVGTTLVNMYGKCGSPKEARAVFGRMPYRNVVSWNAMISAYAQNGHSKEALQVFDQMLFHGFEPDAVSYVGALDACAGLASLHKGQEMPAAIANARHARCVDIGNTLLNKSGICRKPSDARGGFNQMPDGHTKSQEPKVIGCVQDEEIKEASGLFDWMQCDVFEPDQIRFDTYTSQAALEKGQRIHAAIIEEGFECQVMVATALVHMYGKYGRLEEARSTFNRMPHRNVVSWSAMISACAQNGQNKEALVLFDQMQIQELKPDSVAFVCALDACASLSSLEKGQAIDSVITKGYFEKHVVVGNALVNMYGKCGSLEQAVNVFERMPHNDAVSWTSMIAAFAHNGRGEEALDCFMHMQHGGLRPDHATFLSVLAACSHIGNVDDATHYFSSMSEVHGLPQKMEHYLCLIDILGRAGRLDAAEDLITSMPFEDKARVWLYFLSACRLHGDVERGIRTATHALKIN